MFVLRSRFPLVSKRVDPVKELFTCTSLGRSVVIFLRWQGYTYRGPWMLVVRTRSGRPPPKHVVSGTRGLFLRTEPAILALAVRGTPDQAYWRYITVSKKAS